MSINSSKNRIAVYPFKNEHILNSKEESLENKIKALITTWGELASLSSCPSKENLRTLAEFLKSHTLNIVLSASWLKYQDEYFMLLWDSIVNCSAAFSSYKGFQMLCGKLASITKSPWGKPTILQMLNTHYDEIHIQDYNFFVHEESGYFISMRLKKLCEDKCDDMALNLTRAYIKCCEWAESNKKSMFISEDQKKFVYDVYLALLYKFSNNQEMSILLKNVSLAEGIDMVRRFIFKLVSVSKIWVNSIHIAQFAGTVFLTRTVMKQVGEAKVYLLELLNVWLPLYERDIEMDELISCLRRIMKNAISSSHMYLILGKLSDKFGDKMKNYSVEICIQALNTDLNLLEKIKTENDKLKEEETNARIADGLLKLAAIFKDNLHVARECVLSAFSLRPTESCLKQIEDLARASGYEVLDTGQWACKYHPPELAEDDLLIRCSSCGQYMSELDIQNSIKQPNIGLTEALHKNNMDLCQQLRDDLVVIIFCSRYQLLNWIQKWNNLHRLCAMYLNDPNGTKNLITELKYVDIDYTPFLLKREMELSESQEIDFIDDFMFEASYSRKRKRSESPVDGKPLLKSTSDPDVLKTLRSFRRTLKNSPKPKIEPPSSSWHVINSQSNIPSISSQNAQKPVLCKKEVNIITGTTTENGLKIRRDLFDPSSTYNFYSQNHQTYNGDLDEFVENFFKEPVIQHPTAVDSHSSSNDTFSNIQGTCDVVEISTNLNNGDFSLIGNEEFEQNFSNNNHNLYENYIADQFLDETQCKVNDFSNNNSCEKRKELNIKDLEIQETNDIEVLKSINESSCKVDKSIPVHNAIDFFEVPPGQIETSEVDMFKPEELVTIGSIGNLANIDEHLVNVSSDEQAKISNSNENCTSFQEKPNGIINKIIDENVAPQETDKCIVKNEVIELSPAKENGTDVDIEQNVNSIKETSQSLRSKFKIKECSVILTRLIISRKTLEGGTYRKVGAKPKKRGRKSKSTTDNNSSLSENQVQSEERCKDENFNSRFTLPLQNKNQRVLSPNNMEGVMEELKQKLLVSTDKMNPMVILNRLEDSRIKSLLSRVPGISDTKLFLPENTNRIVNVVQIAGGRTTSTVPAQNTQTSTQVSPHIQRIGQPRNEKNDQASNSEATTSTITKSANTYTIAKPAATQSPTLINILSQQVRPTQSNNVRSRTGPLINILSSQSIKAANVTVASKTTTTTVTSDSQVNTPRIIATTTEQQQIINQIVNPGRTTGQIKHVVDGKLIPVTSFPSNRLVKVGATSAVSTTPDSPNLEENVNKLVPNKKTDSNELSETLPKFQQAFGDNAAKTEDRVQSVLVTAGSSNGPMLSHSPPQYKQSETSNADQSKDDFLRNSGKRNEKVANAVYCMQGKKKAAGAGRLDREVQQICLQRRQAAIERELRLQKSLSEECEDLGVDEPSTSDLFPEALLFDSNNSPSFDQSSQDLIKRSVQSNEKEETKLTLFSDDDFMFEPVQYQTGDAQLCYEEVVDSRMITNGQSTRSHCEDNTLLQTCTSMSDVTLSSPISPDTYRTNSPPPLNKYMHKYTNKKKNDRPKHVDTWPSEVSSSEDTTGSNELVKCTGSPDICLNKRSDEELSDGGNFKVVRLSISKSDCAGDLHCSDDVDSLSGRGARKSVKKMCSCCNGADDNAISRKRPSTHQHTTNPHKKAFLNKKR